MARGTSRTWRTLSITPRTSAACPTIRPGAASLAGISRPPAPGSPAPSGPRSRVTGASTACRSDPGSSIGELYGATGGAGLACGQRIVVREEPPAGRQPDGGGGVAHAQLAQEARAVVVDRVDAQVERLRDFLAGEAPGQVGQHLPLARAQGVDLPLALLPVLQLHHQSPRDQR